MSFLDSLVSVGRTAFNFITGPSIGANLARTALTGFALNKVSNAIKKKNEKAQPQQIDPGVRLQIDPDPEYKIPVVYGETVMGAAVTDAELSSDNSTMYFCLTLCEKTGNLDLGQGAPSDFEFVNVYWDDNRIVLAPDGYTVTGFVDKAGVFCPTIGGEVSMFFYSGGSEQTRPLKTFANPGITAINVMPSWGSEHYMEGLVFAIVVIRYNASKNVRGLPNLKFKIRNSMTQPGDCLYDYMTNTVYGAGINPGDINA